MGGKVFSGTIKFKDKALELKYYGSNIAIITLQKGKNKYKNEVKKPPIKR